MAVVPAAAVAAEGEYVGACAGSAPGFRSAAAAAAAACANGIFSVLQCALCYTYARAGHVDSLYTL